MARYRVTELSYIDERLLEPGQEVEFTGVPGPNLTLVEDNDKTRAAANATVKAALATEAKTLKATRLDADGKPTDQPVDGSESLESLQLAIAAVKARQTG
ncbi:hypothetical protein GCM10007874_09860 [Labrys miyagiensis]|uniref:Uncharacterized protein n=1 Tax=Labrys miyagiensis TaxID=346912 RepID=A0ABQ6CDG9_9HYPH|nr:hypothetical protein [Labrys miyagiensis]GLS17970.1 hypothetical protein GCM10007874_09860 [Labrys miyagiensis]